MNSDDETYPIVVSGRPFLVLEAAWRQRTRGNRLRRLLLALFLLASVTAHGETSPGPLSRAHSKLESAANCVECHSTGSNIAPLKCLSCHKALGARVAAKKGLHALPGYEKCARCHSEHRGRGFQLIQWGKNPLDHRYTGYPLIGAHATAGCGQCHKTRGYLGLSTVCTSCHQDVHRQQFPPASCASCHTMTAWKPPSLFKHAMARFELTGKHAAVPCMKCHRAGRYKPILHQRCTDCHKDPHVRRYGASCTSCHSTSAFKPAKFEHTLVPKQSCTNCHRKRDVHAGRLGNKCEQCHRTTGWTPTDRRKFDHSRTRFPLTGGHHAVGCGTCHRESLLRAPMACSACHADPHDGRLGTTCDQCHSTADFKEVIAPPPDNRPPGE